MVQRRSDAVQSVMVQDRGQQPTRPARHGSASSESTEAGRHAPESTADESAGVRQQDSDDADADALQAGAEASTVEAPASGRRPGACMHCSVGAALGFLATAAFVHYYINSGSGSVSAARAVLPHNFESRLKLKGVAVSTSGSTRRDARSVARSHF